MTGYQAHVSRLEADLAGLRGQVAEGNGAGELRSRVFSRRFQLLSLGGELDALRLLYAEIETAVGTLPGPSDLWLLQACIAVKLHRFRDAGRLLEDDPQREACVQGRLIRADLDTQAGDYCAARVQIQRALDEDATWDALARMAYLEGLSGDVEAADGLYLAAQDELTAKEMHAYAWVELQRGVLDFQRGRYVEAEAHYRHASRAYSGYWLVEERLAELDGARGGFDDAIGTYARLYAWRPRAEWAHAMGDLLALRGDIVKAHAWKLLARDGYLASIGQGGVHPLHALADLCCEMPDQRQEAVRWARMDEALRSNYQTQGNVAWALYRSGCVPEAERWIERALSSSVVCGRLYLQAACIFAAAGRCDASTKYFRLAKELNKVPAKAAVAAGSIGMEIRMVRGLRSGVSLPQPGA